MTLLQRFRLTNRTHEWFPRVKAEGQSFYYYSIFDLSLLAFLSRCAASIAADRPWPARKEFSGQVAGWSFRGLKPWQAGADEIGEIRGITRLNGSFVNQGPGFKFRKRQVTR